MAKDISTDGLVAELCALAMLLDGVNRPAANAARNAASRLRALERRNAELEGLLHEVHGYVKHRSPDIANKISKALSHSSETPDDR